MKFYLYTLIIILVIGCQTNEEFEKTDYSKWKEANQLVKKESYEKALKVYKKAFEHTESFPIDSIAEYYVDYANCYKFLEKYDSSLVLLEKGFQKKLSKKSKAHLLNEKAFYLKKLNKTDSAILLYKEALKINKEIDLGI